MNTEEQLSNIVSYDIRNLVDSATYVYDEMENTIESIYNGQDRTDIRAQLFNIVKNIEQIETIARDTKKNIRVIAFKI